MQYLYTNTNLDLKYNNMIRFRNKKLKEFKKQNNYIIIHELNFFLNYIIILPLIRSIEKIILTFFRFVAISIAVS